MIAYIEQYKFFGSVWAIEDREDGLPADKHFFLHDKTRKRYALWQGGCGFGQTNCLIEARKILFDYAEKYAIEKHDKAFNQIENCKRVLAEIGELRNANI